MTQTDASNIEFRLAADLVNNTSRHIFLTGKAGTGKTTFLKYIRANTVKRAVVIAPTGVAAINAGGVTMHSFFQLPFGPFIPSTYRDDNIQQSVNAVADKHSLFQNIRFNADKRELLQELQLLIIDEVSMVRADMLDAMDTILRHFRNNWLQPFGGVQVLYIGDMYQLPPVVANNEWEILQRFYESPFFFSAAAVAAAAPLYIELKKIYRQSDQQFIDVLNRVRNNEVSAADFKLLNERYRPDFKPPSTEKYITLSTHNRKADAINTAALDQLPGKMISFTGTISGEFSDKALPTDMQLQLKEGAQVMFIKNDSGTERRFFNGKLATIKRITGDEIIVTSNDDEAAEMTVEKETWRNIRYNYRKEKDNIEEEELGSFTQYPLRLAWAVTIHKSQGLTFEKAIIDAGASFAAGQVYVALSRCTTLQGLVLLSPLHPGAIATDHKVIAFARKEAQADALQQILVDEEQQFKIDAFVSIFSYKKILSAITAFNEMIPGKKLPDIPSAIATAQMLMGKARDQSAVAEKFQRQLQQLLSLQPNEENQRLLRERVTKAIDYFVPAAGDGLLVPLKQYLATVQGNKKLRKYAADLTVMAFSISQALQKMINASYGDITFCDAPRRFDQYTVTAEPMVSATYASYKKTSVKGSSQAETLALHKEGNSIDKIVSIRQLTEGTIIAHLASFVRSGEILVTELLTEQRLALILPVVIETGADAVTPVKEILGNAFSYNEIRIVLNHWQRIQSQKVKS